MLIRESERQKDRRHYAKPSRDKRRDLLAKICRPIARVMQHRRHFHSRFGYPVNGD